MKTFIFMIFMLSSAMLLGYNISNYAICEEPEPDLFTRALEYFNIIEIKPICPSLETVLYEFLKDFIKYITTCCAPVAGYYMGKVVLIKWPRKIVWALRRLVAKLKVRKANVPRRRKVRFQDRESLKKQRKSRRQTKSDVVRVLRRVYSTKK